MAPRKRIEIEGMEEKQRVGECNLSFSLVSSFKISSPRDLIFRKRVSKLLLPCMYVLQNTLVLYSRRLFAEFY